MSKKLEQYEEKRDFTQTTEPRGDVTAKSERKLSFVIQHHIASRDHYDFRLEWDGALKSWAVPKGPSYNPKDKRLAVEVEDHPLDYRGFEGTIPRGQYGGGTVMIWDEGTWTPLEDVARGFAEGSLKFMLNGNRMHGHWALVRMKPKPGEKGNNWLLIKEKDEYADSADITQYTTSVRSGRTMNEIEQNLQPEKAHMPQHKRFAPKAPKDWSVEGVQITSSDKLLFEDAGITKGDIALYYQKVAARMLPYVEGRLISSVRCPSGIGEACFYKKHPGSDSPGVTTVSVTSADGEAEDYYYITDIRGLMSEVQMNTLEFHTWGSRVDTLETPDVMVFDLDPDVGMGLAQIRQGARDLKGILDQLSLVSYLKTSGGKGYHVVVPFAPGGNWDAFHDFAQNIAKAMEATWPDRYTSNVRKEKRKGRIFIDWLRNGRGATSVAPYSVRARAGAPVSMPIAWGELDDVAPQDIGLAEAVARLRRKDPWTGFFEQKQGLKA